jgi:hypothetical protein
MRHLFAFIARILGLAHFRVVYDTESHTMHLPYHDAASLARVFGGVVVYNPPSDDRNATMVLKRYERTATEAATRLYETIHAGRNDYVPALAPSFHWLVLQAIHDAVGEIKRLRSLIRPPSVHTRGYNPITHAEALIRTLPEDHDGRNTWLLNCGTGPDVEAMRDNHPTYRLHHPK